MCIVQVVNKLMLQKVDGCALSNESMLLAALRGLTLLLALARLLRDSVPYVG